MPCYRCGTRQVDPERGKSPWRRGVLREHQVLICPACQPDADADLDRCARCGSKHLIRRLDQVECLDCRLIRDAEPQAALPAAASPGAAPAPGGSGGDPSGGDAPGGGALAAEVARALEKVLGRR